MTDDGYFFDTDCISAFLWVKNESILTRLYNDKIILPMQVYEEIKKVPPLLKRVENMKALGQLSLESIVVGTEEYDNYLSLAVRNDEGTKLIGKGEAAAIVLSKKYDGTLAGNNLRDIMFYVKKYKLKHITTAEILVQALEEKIITEHEGNKIWADMLGKRRILPATTFTEYLSGH